MDPIIIGIIGLLLFLIVLFTGLPVAFSMMFVGVAGIVLLRSPDAAFQVLTGDIIEQFSSYALCVVPLFSLMGSLASYSGIGTGLFNTTNKMVGHFKGGLAMATQSACALFGAICGSTPATILTMGSVAYPEMKKYNYDDRLTCPTITAGSSLSVLIPPSMWLIVYGSATETSVGKLFLAGFPAGILLLIIYLIIIKTLVMVNPKLAPVSPKATWKERWNSLRSGGLVEVIIVFVLSMGGMFIGWFTPTEAGAVGAAGMLLVSVIQKKMTWKKLQMALKDTVKLTGMVYLILAGATIYGRFFAITKIPIALGNFVSGLSMPGWAVLFVIVLIYLVLGCFVDGVPILLLTIPIFYPVICNTYGYDPIWYGILIVLVLEMGGITPPVGINHFILKGVVKDVPLSTMFRGIWPFAMGSLIACLIIIIFPIIVTFLPALVFG